MTSWPSFKESFIRGDDCLQWLQDLQRAMRRDDDNTREVAIKVMPCTP